MQYSLLRGKLKPTPRADGGAAGTGKRRGRPPKQPSPPPQAVYGGLKPNFLAYLCEWMGCRAELHNLDTLRRHVYVVHGKAERCLWGECGNRAEAEQTFLNGAEFEAHMEEEHMVPMSWHVGDGPSNRRMAKVTDPGDAIPDFLKDKDGNQVSPSVRGQQVEDVITWRNNRRKLAELLRRRDENLPSDESDDESNAE